MVIQTYHPEHYAIAAVADQDYERFYDEEIVYRSFMEYPPVGHMLAVMIESSEEETADNYAKTLAETLKNDIMGSLQVKDVLMIGPTDASIKKINDIYRKMIYLKSKDQDRLVSLKDRAEEFRENNKDKRIRMTFDQDPVNGY